MAASTTASARTLALALFAATAALTPASVSSTEVLPVDVAAKFGAKCLDGSPPTFELTRNVSSTKWVLFLEGGGWCFGPDANATLESCAHRAGFVWPPVSEGERGAGDKQRDTPSSSNNNNNFRVKESQLQDPTSMQFQSFANNLPQFATTSSSADIGGVMAQDPAVNPDFYTWNKVFLHYCDGSSFGGGRDEPIAVSTHDGKPAQMWMRGRNNFNALIAYLQDTIGMANATEVILSGGSAGGLAVFYNVDHLATLLPEGVRLTAFPDAGFFLDAVDTTGEHSYRAGFQGADPVWNVTGSGGTNAKCLAANGGEEWKCLMAPYLAQYIETPLFVMNSVYDAYQLPNILKAPCTPTPEKPCTADENATLLDYRSQFLDAAKAVTSNGRNGVFLDSCYVHEQNVNYCSTQSAPNCVGWSPLETGSKKWGYSTSIAMPNGVEMTPQQAFGAFYRGEKVDAIDNFTFFDNPSCFYQGHPVEEM